MQRRLEPELMDDPDQAAAYVRRPCRDTGRWNGAATATRVAGILR